MTEFLMEEVLRKEETIRKLQLQIGEKDACLHSLKVSNKLLRERAIKVEKSVAPLKRSVELLTAEKSRWLRKERRRNGSTS